MLGATYCQQPGWDFESETVAPIQTDPRLFNLNVKTRADQFRALINDIGDIYATDNVLFTFGCDFQYSNAHINFKVFHAL
jgi:lysosomal alpha-mannosidase